MSGDMEVGEAVVGESVAGDTVVGDSEVGDRDVGLSVAPENSKLLISPSTGGKALLEPNTVTSSDPKRKFSMDKFNEMF